MIGDPSKPVQFPESTLTNPLQFRTASRDIPNVTQGMVDNPIVVLSQAIAGQKIILTRTLKISTVPLNPPAVGGGISNIEFLSGTGGKPNAQAAQMEAIFWVETVQMPDGSKKSNFNIPKKSC